jgi:hypothetical protein
MGLDRSTASLSPRGARQEQPETSNPARRDRRKIVLQQQRPKPDEAPVAPVTQHLSPQAMWRLPQPAPHQKRHALRVQTLQATTSIQAALETHILALSAHALHVCINRTLRPFSHNLRPESYHFSAKRTHDSLRTIISTTAGMYIAFHPKKKEEIQWLPIARSSTIEHIPYLYRLPYLTI